MNVHEAIHHAESLLPGEPAAEGDIDPRWQAIIGVAAFIESSPEEVWQFTAKWGTSSDPDLRDAVATCLLEHLLERHFELLIPRVEALALSSKTFCSTVASCWQFGQAKQPRNTARLNRLLERCGSAA
jgi:hypothetical protein